jgi:hypothetical protein
MASNPVLEYSALLEHAILLVKTCPDHRENLLEECQHWKGEVDKLEVSSSLNGNGEGSSLVWEAFAKGRHLDRVQGRQ